MAGGYSIYNRIEAEAEPRPRSYDHDRDRDTSRGRGHGYPPRPRPLVSVSAGTGLASALGHWPLACRPVYIRLIGNWYWETRLGYASSLVNGPMGQYRGCPWLMFWMVNETSRRRVQDESIPTTNMTSRRRVMARTGEALHGGRASPVQQPAPRECGTVTSGMWPERYPGRVPVQGTTMAPPRTSVWPWCNYGLVSAMPRLCHSYTCSVN